MGEHVLFRWAARLGARPWQRVLWRSTFTLAAVGVAALVRVPLHHVLGDGVPYITFYPAVAVVGMAAGGWAGLAATLLSAVAADWLVLRPEGGVLGPQQASDVVSMSLFIGAGVLISASAEMLSQVRGAERRAAARAQQAEQERRESEERLRLATEAAGMFSWECDLATQTIRWSANATRVIGCRPEDLPSHMAGSSFFVAPEEADRLTRQFAVELRSGAEAFAWEFYGRSEQGPRRYWVAQGRIVRTAAGVPVRIMGITQDISERKWREANLTFLAEVSKHYGRLGSAEAIMAMLGASIGAHLRVATSSFAELSETRGELTLSHTWCRDGHPVPQRTFRLADYLCPSLISACRTGGMLVVHNTQQDPRVSAANCAAVQVQAFVAVPFHRDGELKYLLSVTDDRPREWRPDEVEVLHELANRIFPRLERARAEAALRESERRLALALNGGRMGMWEWDPHTDQAVWNAREYELLGLPPDAGPPSGQLFFRHVHPEDAAPLRQSLGEAVGAGEEWQDEFRVVLSEGSVRWLAAAARVLRNAAGQPERIVGVNYDITERKQFQADLERLVAERTAKLQELVGELEHFSYSITHDMRAPLRAMRAFAEAASELNGEDSREQQAMFLGRIMTAAERMDALITDALNYNKAVRHELPLAPVDVGRLVRGMVDTYPEFQTSNARIEIASNMPLVLGNEAALTQCFSNLLGNAVKFAAPGQKAVVRVRSEPRDGWVRLWVEDNGQGIAESMLPRVFDMFSRGSGAQAGTGIGLALVRKVVDRMGGRVGVESVLGQGSRFWLELKRGEPLQGK